MADIEQRVRFERHCGGGDLARLPSGEYRNWRVENDWRLWQAALASQPQAPAAAAPRTDGNFLFSLIKECRSHVRRAGIKGDDYGLCHESRMLALRYEQGDFDKAMELCRTLTAAPSPEVPDGRG